jgi:tetratricopeptide (TPR) repeat protein
VQSLSKAVSCFGANSRLAGLRRTDLATLLQIQAKYPEAQALFEQNIALGCFDDSAEDRARNLANLGLVLKLRGELAQARSAYDSAAQVLRDFVSSTHPDVGRLQANIASLLAHQNDDVGTEAMYRQAILQMSRTLGADHHEVAVVRNNLCAWYLNTRQFKRARQALEMLLDTALETLGPLHRDTLLVMGNLAAAHYYLNDFKRASTMALMSLKGKRTLLGPAHPESVIEALNAATLLIKTGNATRAAEVLADATRAARPLWATGQTGVLPLLNRAASLLQRLGQADLGLLALEVFLQSPTAKPDQPLEDLYRSLQADRKN